ncbi:hypothetical protein BDP27DRAFT_1406792 [Rhodocollybia butyracea]|uniref:Uncharacterized protein n=1 Tax=Rhodocollybia butyracea TaxID=206335 RepID=A0A9P5PD46_9AGAR|nr:hypothetical protein BDP27DRAFT_1406792 [Rhodocollybia butyracea]
MATPFCDTSIDIGATPRRWMGNTRTLDGQRQGAGWYYPGKVTPGRWDGTILVSECPPSIDVILGSDLLKSSSAAVELIRFDAIQRPTLCPVQGSKSSTCLLRPATTLPRRTVLHFSIPTRLSSQISLAWITGI